MIHRGTELTPVNSPDLARIPSAETLLGFHSFHDCSSSRVPPPRPVLPACPDLLLPGLVAESQPSRRLVASLLVFIWPGRPSGSAWPWRPWQSNPEISLASRDSHHPF